MDVNAILQAIGSLGFPIVMCIMMWVQQNKINEQHKAEMDKLTESLNNNTQALVKLSEKLEGVDRV